MEPPPRTVNDGWGNGTFVVKELVYAYAMCGNSPTCRSRRVTQPEFRASELTHQLGRDAKLVRLAVCWWALQIPFVTSASVSTFSLDARRAMPTDKSHLIQLIRLVEDPQRASMLEPKPRRTGPAPWLPPTMIVLPTRQSPRSVPARQLGTPVRMPRVISAQVKERK